MAEDADGLLWITCDGSAEVVVVDPTTGEVTGAIPMSSHGGHFMVMNADSTTAYVSNKDTAYLSVIDCQQRRLTGDIPIHEGCEGLCLSPYGEALYVMGHMGSPLPNPHRPTAPSLYAIDTNNHTVIGQTQLNTLPAIPTDADTEIRVSVTPDGQHLLVSAFRWNTLVVLDRQSLSITKTLAVDPEPMNFAYTSQDPRGSYFTSHRAGLISRLDLDSLTITERVPSTPPPHQGRPEHLCFVSTR